VKTVSEIIALSDNKLDASQLLAACGHYDDAYYLGGYAFELRLKAKICKTLEIPDFFDFDNAKNRRLPVKK
jgi:hypothetical protein